MDPCVDERLPHRVPVGVVEAGVAEQYRVLGERDRVTALGRDAMDLVGAELRVPQHRQRHRDDATGIRAGPLVDVPVVVGLDGRQREILVRTSSEQPAGEGRERREAHAREHATRAHVLHALVDVVAAGPHLLEGGGVDAVLLGGPAGDGVQPDVRDRLTVEGPYVVTVFGAFDPRRPVGVLRRHPAFEHVRRFDDVVVHADEDHLVDVHGLLPSEIFERGSNSPYPGRSNVDARVASRRWMSCH